MMTYLHEGGELTESLPEGRLKRAWKPRQVNPLRLSSP